MKCIYHLCDNTLKGKQTSYCSNSCRVKYQIKLWRKRTKQRSIEYLGGKCVKCGYNRCPEAMDFHHRDPTQKDFAISKSGNCTAWNKIQKELDKCDLLCSNCHRESHAIDWLEE